jgi:hypothetical protein
MPYPEGLVTSGGKVYRDDGTIINPANYIGPQPNGDQSITVASAGIQMLTPPNPDSIRADLVCPVDCWVRFVSVPSVGVGEFCPAGTKIRFTSAEQIAAAQIYVTAPCGLFVQYYK